MILKLKDGLLNPLVSFRNFKARHFDLKSKNGFYFRFEIGI